MYINSQNQENLDSIYKSISEFVLNAPTSFHTSSLSSAILLKSGAHMLHEEDSFNQIEPGQMYVVVRDGAVAAFMIPKKEQKIFLSELRYRTQTLPVLGLNP